VDCWLHQHSPFTRKQVAQNGNSLKLLNIIKVFLFTHQLFGFIKQLVDCFKVLSCFHQLMKDFSPNTIAEIKAAWERYMKP